MTILAFDTSNNTSSVAISQGQNILAYIEDLNPSKQAEHIVPMIQEVLKLAHLDYRDINYLGVIKGPGSFTGIRIGLATARGILISTKIKGLALTNFAIAYYRAKQQLTYYDEIIVILNAYRSQFYVQIFDKISEATMPQLLDYSEIIKLLSDRQGIIACAGNGLELLWNDIKTITNIIVLPRFPKIKALHICRLVDDIIRDNKQHLHSDVNPLYIRPADAMANVVQFNNF